jgi:hypothetical protein
MRRFVGFYWTFPVRWAGFLDLPNDAARAAQASRTVAYQRSLVRQYVEDEKGELVGEVAAIEVSPDRGTNAIEGDVAKAGRLCRDHEAELVHVDFYLNRGWRPHPILAQAIHALRASGIETVDLPAHETILDGHWFDPAEHFSMWRANDEKERTRRRAEVPAALRQALDEVPTGRGRWKRIADLLNGSGVPTLGGGRAWTPDNVRKAAGTLGDPTSSSGETIANDGV